MVSKSGIKVDFYRATCSIWIGDKKERIIAYVGACKDFEGDENSKEVFEVAKVKMKQAILKKHNVIFQNTGDNEHTFFNFNHPQKFK